MRKLEHNVVNVTIPAGETIPQFQKLTLESGTVIKCALLTDDVPNKTVNIKIEDNNNNELHPFVSYKEYQPTNGNHFESRKSISFEGNRDIKIIAQAKEAMTTDFTFQMLFYIDQS